MATLLMYMTAANAQYCPLEWANSFRTISRKSIERIDILGAKDVAVMHGITWSFAPIQNGYEISETSQSKVLIDLAWLMALKAQVIFYSSFAESCENSLSAFNADIANNRPPSINVFISVKLRSCWSTIAGDFITDIASGELRNTYELNIGLDGSSRARIYSPKIAESKSVSAGEIAKLLNQLGLIKFESLGDQLTGLEDELNAQASKYTVALPGPLASGLIEPVKDEIRLAEPEKSILSDGTVHHFSIIERSRTIRLRRMSACQVNSCLWRYTEPEHVRACIIGGW